MNKAILFFLITCIPLPAANISCDLALESCKALVTAQDQQILHLQQAVKQLETKLEQDSNPLIPWWGWMIIGGVGGGILVHEVSK